MSQINCRLELPTQSNSQAVNVGDRLPLVCSGSFSPPLTAAARTVWTDKNMGHTLDILDVRAAASNQVEFIVAGYRPGEHKISLLIEEGGQKFETNEIEFKVESILDPANPNPQAFPSKGPYRESYPMGIWIALGGALILFALFIVWGFLARQKVRRIKDEMDKMKSFLSPIGQVSKDLREIQKKRRSEDYTSKMMVQDLDRSFRLYLVREFQIPAHRLDEKEVLRAFRKRNRILFEANEPELRRLLNELASAQKDHAPLGAEDCDELLQITRNLVERLYSVRAGGRA